ncbi:MAG: hypothetical protein COA43_03545 [Robiginitomaculum sp.]|nr:MAG: hypothetical protein COA43_03545 [Robiginitomaculum sp.]
MTDRRHFLKTSLGASLGAGAMSFIGGTSILGALGSAKAHAANVEGYKALVCVFLFGGQDCHDTILPYDQASYDGYAALRTGLMSRYAAQNGGSTRARDRLLPLNPTNASQFSGRQFAMPEPLAPLKSLFDAGNVAILGNVGPLIHPLNAAQFEESVIAQPKRLFSHNDQQSTWMSSAPEGEILGWGGKFSDAALAAKANQQETFTAISTSGNTVFLAGENTTQYSISAGGPPPVDGLRNYASELLGSASDSELAISLLEKHYASTTQSMQNLYGRDLIAINKRAAESNTIFSEALENAPTLQTVFPNTRIGQQLRDIANTINIKNALGVGRQVFFASLGGFDTHDNQVRNLSRKQNQYAQAIAAFYQATAEMGAQNEVTLFTASDFGRSLAENGDGTDHGWGSHHFIVGGAVNGNKIYGDIPKYELGHAQDAGSGRLIPQTSVEQYAATLGKWFGLSNGELNAALPALKNFTQKDLGFMNGPGIT